MRAFRTLLLLALGTVLPCQAPPELVTSVFVPAIDGDLAEWGDGGSRIALAESSQVIDGKESWSGAADLSGRFLVSSDSNHLYLAGVVEDDHLDAATGLLPTERTDRIEVWLGFGTASEGGSMRAEDRVLVLTPLQTRRPWTWTEPGKQSSQQSATQLAGIRLAGKRLGPTSFSFEAAIPFHHFPALRPGTEDLAFNLVLRDHDAGDAGRAVALSWNGRDPLTGNGLGVLRLPSPGALVGGNAGGRLLDSDLLADLRYLLVPLLALVGLVVLLRGWGAVRERARWLRPVLIGGGLVLCVLGLCLPRLQSNWRAEAQRTNLDADVARLTTNLALFEQGTLASYRGVSRDRALVELLNGRVVARQKFTKYRYLSQINPEFGPPLRQFDDLPVRAYWLPLGLDRAENFQFDAPLRGSRLHLVVGRPSTPPFTFSPRSLTTPRLELELDYIGPDGKRRLEVDLDRAFADAQSLGRDFWEVCIVPVALDRDLRAITVAALRGADLRLVGISLEGSQPGRIEPVFLGQPSRQGVLTDLRGPYPQDAGIELAPGAAATIAIPASQEPPQRLWFFHRAIYPGVPTANPGARVGEIVLHFGPGKQKRSILLEHQVSVFYELAVHNTRDEPPEGSPASIALSWLDDSQERHVNLGIPVTDLPAGAALTAIEFRNLAEYRLRFRSVVFVDEQAAAPQDPPDSPLSRVSATERQLSAEFLAPWRDNAITIYRAGQLSESTLGPEQRAEVQALPRAAAGGEPITLESLAADGGRRVTMFTPLRGDGWDGAVLAMSATDPQWVAAARDGNRLGLVLVLASAPFLLVLLGELLAVAASLRFRLLAVTTVAALAPLGLLSVVLVQVLEQGHAADVADSVRATVRSASVQLADQKARVASSARQWLQDLSKLAVGKLGESLVGKDAAAGAELVAPVDTELRKLLAGQLPPEWSGGFLRLDWQPRAGKLLLPARALVAGDERLANADTQARLDPGLFLQWGTLMLGVRAEAEAECGTFELTAARPLDGNVLGTLAPRHDVLLTDVRGYPIAASPARTEGAGQSPQLALDPATMARCERALADGLEQRQPIVSSLATSAGDLVCGSDVLRDLQDTPRALLLVAQPDQRATLDLAVGRVGVRAFFLLVAGSLVVLSVFLSFVVSGRISRPIERLEQGAQALSRGQLETRVPVEDRGQIGRLTRAFNQMATDLQGRLIDLQALNRTMSELTGEHDESTTVDVLRRFCRAHTAADAVGIVLVDVVGQELVVHRGEADGKRMPLASVQLASLVGPFVCVARGEQLPAPWSAVLPTQRSAIGLPIVFGGQTRGVLVLGFDCPQPLPVDLDLLSTVVAQAAVAFERCQLQRLAVQDPVTATYTAEYFRRRVVDEVSLAQQRGRGLAMLAMALGDGERRPRGLRRFAALLRERLPRQAILCHAGSGLFHVALPGVSRAQAEASLAELGASWAELVHQLPENDVEAQPPRGVVVHFPDEAPSAEFLFEALRARIAALHTPGASAMESDESLQRAGVMAVSPAMRDVYGTLRRVAPTDIPILLEGETGVGKEVLTNLVHRWSRRAGGPLVKVHCASLSETLLASELFGHEKGAFTGADRRKISRFEQADGGTLFFDEVGEIPLDVQVKLLRVLQEGEVDRVGGSEPVRVDVRVIAATNRDIARMVADGRFREDLYYRLQGMVVKVPPLRERKQELTALVEHFRSEIVGDGHAPSRSWSTEAMDELFRQEWPGNIRQLRNAVFRAMVMARGDIVQQRDVQVALVGSIPGQAAAEVAPVAVASPASAPAPVVVVPALPPTVAAAPAVAPPVAPAAASANPEPAQPDSLPVEPVFVLPPPPTAEPGVVPDPVSGSLSPRLAELLAKVTAQGTYSTQEHMVACGLSHRTALRDLQALVQLGRLERVGSRRGTFYRPSAPTAGA